MDNPHFNGEPGALSTDPERQPRWERDETPIGVCDRPGCGRTVNYFAVSIASLGQFCSRACADKEQAEFDTYMKRGGHMTATGERS